MATHRDVDADSSQINTLAAFVFGALLVVVGLLGFTVSGGHEPAGHSGGNLLGLFEVNLLHNLVHLAVGALMIIAAVAGTRAAKALNTIVGLLYLALAVAGLFLLHTTSNILAINHADNILHLVLGTVLTAIGVIADRGETRRH
jgi:hypothetical protein